VRLSEVLIVRPWDFVNQRMSREERQKVTVLFALTPEEQAMREEMNSHA